MESYLNGLNEVTVKKGSSGVSRLAPGNVLHAVVEEGNGDNRYTISSGNLRLQVTSQTPLNSGQKLDLMVVARPDGKIALENLPPSLSAAVISAETVTISKDLLLGLDGEAVKDFSAFFSKDDADESSRLEGRSNSASAQQSGSNVNDITVSTDSLSADSNQTVSTGNALTAGGRQSLQVNTVSVSGSDAAGFKLVVDEKSRELLLESPTGVRIPVKLFEGGAENLARYIDDSSLAQSVSQAAGGEVTVRNLAFFLEVAVAVPGADNDTVAQNVRVALPVTAQQAVLLSSLPSDAIMELVADPAAGNNAYQLVAAGRSIPLTLESGLSENLVLNENGIAQAQLLQEALVDVSVRITTVANTGTEVLARTPIDAFLQTAGLTPSAATREVATVLHDASLPVNRENVQNLLALAAGKSGDQRLQTLIAGARLIAIDAPVSPAFAAGLAALGAGQPGINERVEGIISSLKNAAGLLSPEDSQRINAQARVMDTLSVLVGEKDTSQSLANFVRSFGREVLADTISGIENTIDSILDKSQPLKILSAALEVVMAKSANISEGDFQQQIIQAGKSFASSLETGSNAIAKDLTQEAVLPQAPSDTATATLSQPSSALDSPVTTEVTQLQQAIEDLTGKNSQALLEGNAVKELRPDSGLLQQGETVPAPSGSLSSALEQLSSRNLISLLDSLQTGSGLQTPSHPGVEDFPDSMRPVAEQFRQTDNVDREALRNAVDLLDRAQTPAQAADTARQVISGMDVATLRELATVLQHAEREEITRQPGMNELREAAASVRELGRAFVAQKLDNLAGQRLNPEMYAASVPLKFGGDGGSGEGGDGNLQMFYRRSARGSGKDWTQRVVLELDMSELGNVVGDIRFYEGVLNLALLTPQQDAADWLESGLDELSAALADVGFPCTPGVRLIKKALKEDAPPVASAANNRLDIKA